MKRSYRFTAALAALALAAGCTLPAFAAGEVTKDENVFIILNADGSVKSQTVSNWVHSDAGLSGFADATTLQNVTNLKGEWRLEQSGGSLTFEGSGSDVYYQGTTDKTPPVTAAITYTLDGAPIAAGELAGKAGRVGIHIALTNHEKYQRTIGGSLRDVYTPFVAMIAVDLPAGAFTNITAEHGTVQTDAQNQLVAFAALPGMKATFDGLLPDQLDGLYDYFLDEVTVEADTECFEAPAILLAAATSMEELKKDGLAGTDGLDELDGKLDELENATRELQDGIAALRDGAGSLVEGVTTLNDAVGTLNGGAGELADGAQKLANGAAEVADGASALNGLLGQVCQNNDTLNQGAGSIFSALLASATAQLRAQAGQLGLDPAAIPELTGENYAAVIGGLLTTVGEENVYAQVRAGVEAQVKTDENRQKAVEQVSCATAATIYAKQQAPNADQAAIEAAVAGILADPAQVQAVMADAGIQAALATAEMQAMIAQTAEAQLDAKVAGAMSEGGAAYDQLQAALQAAGSAGQQLNAALAQLGQVESFVTGLAAYTGSVQQIYQQGVGPLNEGAKQVRDGAGDLNSGAAKLRDGTASLKSGTETLLDGAIRLSGGAGDLAGGMEEYKTQGIDEITGKLGGMNLTALTELGDMLEELADGYTSYTGAPEGIKASVKFVMKVEGPKAPAEGADDGRQAARAEAQPAEKPGFWQRVKNLFR